MRLMDYLPENYPNSRETVAFQEAFQPELDAVWAARDALLAQLDPYSATWGLTYWEDALGLGPCEAFPLDIRRRQIAAKLQGRATTTLKVLKDVAETMLGVPVKVIEIFGEYRVELELDSRGRLPAGVGQLKTRLRDIMPAHLDWHLVIPTVLFIPIRAALGPRMASTAPPMYHAPPPTGRIHAASCMGTRYSTITLPMAAQKGGNP